VFVIEVLGQLISELFGDNGIFRVPAINVVPGIARGAAQVLASALAEFAGAVHVL
jgi:hypothetical protein